MTHQCKGITKSGTRCKRMISEGDYCNLHMNLFATKSPKKSPSRTLMKKNSPLDDKEESYCGCIARVSAKQSPKCLKERAWGQTVSGKTCYNPYAVCAKSTGTTSKNCFMNYSYKNFTDKELKGYSGLEQIPIPKPYNRQEMLKKLSELTIK